MRSCLFLLLLTLAACRVSQNPLRRETRLLQRGRIRDDSSFVYDLPYQAGRSHWLVQGYFSHFSHRERAALDFRMKKGTPVCAARGGVVVRLKEDGTRGGWSRRFRPDGNFVVIQHEDGTRAGYWHLQHNGVQVQLGDTVRRGQVIAYSGRTGYAAFPHLHFLVWNIDSQGHWSQVPTRFRTCRGNQYLRPLKWYRHPSE